jgi:anti-sigma B factor antagonist
VDEHWDGRPTAGDPGIEPLTLGGRVTTSHGDHCVVAAVTGSLDALSVTAMRDRLHGHVYAGVQHLVLDLSRVTFVDSVGLSMLIGLRRLLATRNGTLHLAACATPVLDLMELTSLTRTFTMHDTVAEAEAASAAA